MFIALLNTLTAAYYLSLNLEQNIFLSNSMYKHVIIVQSNYLSLTILPEVFCTSQVRRPSLVVSAYLHEKVT